MLCGSDGNTIKNMQDSWLPQPKRFPTPDLAAWTQGQMKWAKKTYNYCTCDVNHKKIQNQKAFIHCRLNEDFLGLLRV